MKDQQSTLVRCRDKVAFESFSLANRVNKERNRKRAANRTVYRCSFCHLYHIGNVMETNVSDKNSRANKQKRAKKYKQRYTEDQMISKVISRLDDASADQEPLDRDRAVGLMLSINAAMDALMQGVADMKHMQMLAMNVNMAMALVEVGFGNPGDFKVATDARDALHQIGLRRQRTGKWGASGQELQTIRKAIELREAQLECEDNRQGIEIKCAKEIDRRIASGNTVKIMEFA